MEKNLILIHLESVNRLLFANYAECFPNLNRLRKSSVFFTNYYSSATSTLMVTTDLFYGDAQFENAQKAREMFVVTPQHESLFDELHDLGYKTFCLYHGSFMKPPRLDEYFHALSVKSEAYNTGDEKGKVLEKIRTICREEKFAVFLRNDRSHLSCMNEFSDSEISSLNYENRFAYVDAVIGEIFSVLREEHRLDDTVVVIYGDHGDDFYGHGLHDGYMHAIEPLPYLIHCPLLIYGMGGGIDDRLLGTQDLARVIREILSEGRVAFRRDYVFSRNLFVAQDLCLSSFNKSYSVTNGRYTLVVTNVGLAMFVNRIDPASHCNLLAFFHLAGENIKYNTIFDYCRSDHFRGYFTRHEIDFIEKNYSDLYVVLKKFVLDLYGGDCPMCFTRAQTTAVTRGEWRRLRKRKYLSAVREWGKMRFSLRLDSSLYRWFRDVYIFLMR